MWQVAWAHPKFGSLLASCSYDGKVIIYKEQSLNQWTQAYTHEFHEASVNSIAWAPHEYGLSLACASADGTVSIISYTSASIALAPGITGVYSDSHFCIRITCSCICIVEGWSVSHFKDSSLGCNAVSWAPFHSLGSKSETGGVIRRVVTASCDKTIKIWSLEDGATEWTKSDISAVPAHSDWVRDVAWAPSTGMPVNLIASCSEDKHVYIWSQTEELGAWKRELLHTFDAPVWRVSWSVTGNVLAVSSGDHKVTLWKETLDKKWMYVQLVDDACVWMLLYTDRMPCDAHALCEYVYCKSQTNFVGRRSWRAPRRKGVRRSSRMTQWGSRTRSRVHAVASCARASGRSDRLTDSPTALGKRSLGMNDAVSLYGSLHLHLRLYDRVGCSSTRRPRAPRALQSCASSASGTSSRSLRRTCSESGARGCNSRASSSSRATQPLASSTPGPPGQAAC